MPANKNASYRYRLIDYCLRYRKKKWKLADLQQYISDKLIEEFDMEPKESGFAISERSLLDDIAVMRKDPPQGYAAPIIRKGGYIYYNDPEFSIHNFPFNEQDLLSLQEAGLLLKQFAIFPHYRHISGFLEKLHLTIAGQQDPLSSNDVVHFEKNEELSGIDRLSSLYYFTRHRQPVSLEYLPFDFEEPLRTTLCPYLLKEYNNRWFLIGCDLNENSIRNYAIDRIVSFSSAEADWYDDPTFEVTAYFRDIIGVTLPEGNQVEQVLFRASPSQSHYIRTKPLHSTQTIVSSDPHGTVFSCRLILNYELESQLLSFGETVEVLEPVSLRERIRDRLVRASQHYAAKP